MFFFFISYVLLLNHHFSLSFGKNVSPLVLKETSITFKLQTFQFKWHFRNVFCFCLGQRSSGTVVSTISSQQESNQFTSHLYVWSLHNLSVGIYGFSVGIISSPIGLQSALQCRHSPIPLHQEKQRLHQVQLNSSAFTCCSMVLLAS